MQGSQVRCGAWTASCLSSQQGMGACPALLDFMYGSSMCAEIKATMDFDEKNNMLKASASS
jgi:hypothetical protein